MSEQLNRIRKKLGADFSTEVTDVGGGAFGAARMAGIIARLQTRLVPSQGLRPGRPTDPTWVESPKVPMSAATLERLSRFAATTSVGGRKISPMQLAAQLLEESLARLEQQGLAIQ